MLIIIEVSNRPTVIQKDTYARPTVSKVVSETSCTRPIYSLSSLWYETIKLNAFGHNKPDTGQCFNVKLDSGSKS